jgi:aminoglycoside phosphotransferase (APT) family kinase protein
MVTLFLNLRDNFNYLLPGSNFGLVHQDFHLQNIMRTKDGKLILIDCDYLGFGPIERCRALGILRLSVTDRVAKEEMAFRLEKNIKCWMSSLGLQPDRVAIYQHIYYMFEIELEKTLRVLTRYLEMKVYGGFLKNIVKRHLPNLHVLSEMLLQHLV